MTLIDAGMTAREELASSWQSGTAWDWVRLVKRFLTAFHSFPRTAWECRPRRSASVFLSTTSIGTQSVQDGIPARSVGTSDGWLGSSCRSASIALTIAGCGASGDSPLIVASTWSPPERTQIEAAYHELSGDRQPIVWVAVGPGERLESAIDRRGGVDILLGGPPSVFGRLETTGRLAGTKPMAGDLSRQTVAPGVTSLLPGDPRLDPDSFAIAKSILDAHGWPKGYEALVRAASRSRTIVREAASFPLIARPECVALVRGGPNPTRATRFLQFLDERGLSKPTISHQLNESAADDLLADLLGSALVDSVDELREAEAALIRFGHPAQAEAAIGERPPWPPASVAKLMVDPSGQPMLETLLEQIAPDPEARAWLVESWSKPKRPIDGALLAEIASAADGRLALESRFRAWLRGEWTAWTRQLYRRVARVAGGYVPS